MTTHVNFEPLLQEGCRVTVISTSCLADLQSEVERRTEQGQFDGEFARKYMFRFKFTPPTELKKR